VVEITPNVTISSCQAGGIVSLKVAKADLAAAAERLGLAAPLTCSIGSNNSVNSLWIGPDQWLLMSETQPATAIIERCVESLSGLLFNALDQSAGLSGVRIAGTGARRLLAAGCALDLRDGKFTAGSCCRTRFAEIPAVIVATTDASLEMYVDRSYEKYLIDWLEDSARSAA